MKPAGAGRAACRRVQRMTFMGDQCAEVIPIKPWHRCPPCPHGCGHIAVLRENAPRPECYHADINLVCPACGEGFMGTAVEVEQARRADAAWETENSDGVA